ncbi:regulatory LuxR family protein [Herbihabitans rhizosphaerae]|uniref:Regulatory LuxR family protein n=1 Tax=Herbihabitans rhizosphaerae TaxID=1872711 RepID=A0A4Q7KIU7_9PSEU|nr:LuxR family transcriptional regulator [Herbihabitans rhizosphaerae]RZS36335.1 regulatory LuxR family protein [Herbihabitans rhizosphaerae]
MTLFQREEQLRRLEELLFVSAEGHGQLVVLDGPAGCGKTAILGVFAERTVELGATFLDATCSPVETPILGGVIDQLTQHPSVPVEVAVQVTDFLRGNNFTALPTGHESAVPAAAIPVFSQLATVIRNLASEHPLVLAIDNVRHADDLSIRFLLYLARRLRSTNILILATDDLCLPARNLPLRAELLRHADFNRIPLRPLSRSNVSLLLRLLGAPPECSTDEAMTVAGGNPLLLRALVQDHQEFGGIRAHSFGMALLGCVHHQDAILLKTTRALAVLGEHSTPAELGLLVGEDADAVDGAIRAMNLAGMLDGSAFRSPVSRAAVLEELASGEHVELRRRAARLLHDRQAGATEIARHLVAAEDASPPWATDVLLEAAEQALFDGDQQLAAACFTLTLSCCDEEPARTAVRARLAQTEWQMSPSAAAKHLSSLTYAAAAGRLADADRSVLIRQLLWHGRDTEAARLLNQWRYSAGDRAEDSGDLRDVESWLAACHPTLSRRSSMPVADDILAPDTDPSLKAAAALADAILRGRHQDRVDLAVQSLRDVHLRRHTVWLDESLLLAGTVMVCAGRSRTATELCEGLLADPRTRRVPTLHATVAAVRADLALRQGDLFAAESFSREATSLVPAASWGVVIGIPLGCQITAATRLGKYEESARLITQAIPAAMLRSRYGLPYLHARGQHHLATNHLHAALSDFLSCGELVRKWALDVDAAFPWRTSAAEAWLALDNTEQARQLANDVLTRTRSDTPASRARALRILALTYPANRRMPLLSESLDIFEESGDRFEQARVLGDLSQIYFTKGDSRRARLLLRRALHVADMCGARPQYRELLSASGELGETCYPPIANERIGTLTASERRVASLAVMGHTNREIAHKLYVTPSTVEQHLTRAFRKLGVKRRKDLPVELWTETTKTG